ncbi:hypothetical protein ES702_01453 [subsurface metagenome]
MSTRGYSIKVIILILLTYLGVTGILILLDKWIRRKRRINKC